MPRCGLACAVTLSSSQASASASIISSLLWSLVHSHIHLASSHLIPFQRPSQPLPLCVTTGMHTHMHNCVGRC